MNDMGGMDLNGRSRRAALLHLGLAASAVALTAGAARATGGANGANDAGDDLMRVGMVVFDGFQLLDVFGPLEMFGALRDRLRIVILAQNTGLVASSAGPAVAVDRAFADAPDLDVLLVPGGMGTRREVGNAALIEAVKALALKTPHVASICTGAAILARTGVLDGARATTNKRAFAWATAQGPKVDWVERARWVEDGKYFTSSGISAGMDMSLALIAKLFGGDTATRVANGAEYRWNRDPDEDPFAALNGLAR
ncbi:DJ-1/PfpI family protein [Lysobacter yananisis]|uniref:DJ-1/PfpI family protein n=1 Tax=Lysobacter yananisis TaxID=1003114 RepID=A0ABY9P3P4_9GAMM|nr:DJ-1/PfpI family protein [Lysobacter yananisis]WMT01564.1 DJ-1/PfpI family protein [Lysobacter yananisis]